MVCPPLSLDEEPQQDAYPHAGLSSSLLLHPQHWTTTGTTRRRTATATAKEGTGTGNTAEPPTIASAKNTFRRDEQDAVVPSAIPSIQEMFIKGGAIRSDSSYNATLPSSSSSLGQRIQSGTTLLTLSGLLSKEEITQLAQSSIAASCSGNQDNSNDTSTVDNNANTTTSTRTIDNEDVKGRLVVRMPTHAAGRQSNCPKDALPESLSETLEEIVLARTFEYIDRHLCPSLKTTLFDPTNTNSSGNTNTNDHSSNDDDKHTLLQLFRNDQLEYSTREPAVNVYRAPHGHFGIHRDGKALTILMPLSDPSTSFEQDNNDDESDLLLFENQRQQNDGSDGDFTGGGTAFWSQAVPQEGRDDPSLILRPPAGTIVLFGGQVYHSGLHIQSGTRVVFVASFSSSSIINSAKPTDENGGAS
jgi:hypothetical protein